MAQLNRETVINETVINEALDPPASTLQPGLAVSHLHQYRLEPLAGPPTTMTQAKRPDIA